MNFEGFCKFMLTYVEAELSECILQDLFLSFVKKRIASLQLSTGVDVSLSPTADTNGGGM